MRESLRYTLTRQGYRVLTAADGPSALETARSQHPDLVILDLILPGMDGFEVCRILRRESTVPILILTARDEEVDRVLGLELGADDYVTKPFSMRELVARVKALLRRASMAQQMPPRRLESGDLVLDLEGRKATKGGQPLPLKPKEFDLLAYLMAHKGKAFSREHLLTEVWGYDYTGESRTVDVHIRWLREKIEKDPANPVRIITLRGVGYRFEG
ncbi:response regulator transcription factor [Thermus sp.]|uniref:response regulator transcription factor n=1 Tax=Thermus sp. TaxID=275 RepID=UPI0025D8D725|nr:response regulator transcription factor [Thermus sp.]MCS6869527.1 response regulator transcription factor [Thermus sp.]